MWNIQYINVFPNFYKAMKKLVQKIVKCGRLHNTFIRYMYDNISQGGIYKTSKTKLFLGRKNEPKIVL